MNFTIATIIKATFKSIFSFHKTLFKFSHFLLSKILRKNLICFLIKDSSMKYENIMCIYHALKDELKCKLILDNHFSLKNLLLLAQAKIILQDQSTYIIRFIYKNTSTKIVQLWHGAGLYKKVGFDAMRVGFDPTKEQIRIQNLHKCIDYFITSDKKISDTYSKAFGIDINNIIPLGIPRTDKLLSSDTNCNKKIFFNKYKIDHYKQIYLYAPTYRVDFAKKHRYNLEGPNINALKIAFPNTIFLWRNHPTLSDLIPPSGWLNATDFDQEFCLSISDILITDYSSILFDFSLLNRPIYLFIPDFDYYTSNERGVYISPNDLLPDCVCSTNEELISKLKLNINRSLSIRKKFMSSCDGHSVDRVKAFIKGL